MPYGQNSAVSRLPSGPKTLFAHRKLENADDFIAWAKGQGFPTTVPPQDMHVTLAYSKEPFDWPDQIDDQVTVRRRSGRSVEALGDGGAVVLRFESPTLEERWAALKGAGASSDYDTYKPHVTISWKGDGVNLDQVKPYAGDLVFGPEVFRPLDGDWKDKMTEKGFNPDQPRAQDGKWTSGGAADGGGPAEAGAVKDAFQGRDVAVRATKTPGLFEFHATPKSGQDVFGVSDEIVAHLIGQGFHAEVKSVKADEGGNLNMRAEVSNVTKGFEKASVFKVDEALGLVFGWAIVSKVNGEDYFDLQGDHIPEAAMLKASADFMGANRTLKEMHDGDGKGSVLFAWPLTTEIAKAMGITTKQTGLMIAVKPDNPEVLAKFKSGEYTGFSIGGNRVRDKEVADAA